MTIYYLLAIVIVMFLITYFSSGEDILSPNAIVCAMWIFSILCAIYNIQYWNINIHWNTIGIIFIGLLSFIIGSVVVNYLHNYNNKNKLKIDNKPKPQITVIRVWMPAFVFLLIVNIITLIMQYRWLMSVVGSFSNWTEMMKDFRSSSSSWSLDAIQKSSILSNLETLLAVDSYIFAYIGINNTVAVVPLYKNIVFFLPSVIYTADLLLNAGRGDILLLVGGMLLMVYIINQQKYGWKIKFSRKYLKVVIVSLVVVCVLFSYARIIVGRIDDSDTISYITTYAGGSVQLFDMYLQNPMYDDGTIFGKETFNMIINVLGKQLGISSWSYLHHAEFRISNGVNIGNVYGAFRPYYNDFGLMGVIILSMFEGVLYSFLYLKVKNSIKIFRDGFDWSIFLYIYFARSLFMYSIASYTYSLLGNYIALIKWLVIAWIIKRIVVNRNITKISL